MVRFTFVTGAVQEFPYNWEKLAPKLTFQGIRLFTPAPNIMIPLNSATIALIERIGDEVEETKTETTTDTVVIEAEPVVEEEPEPKKEMTEQERKDKILADMKELSSCPHEEYEYHYQMVMTGPKTNQKAAKRYFPVCKKCGVRERFVKADTLTDEEKANAKLWDK